jgi:hypothetical protein
MSLARAQSLKDHGDTTQKFLLELDTFEQRLTDKFQRDFDQKYRKVMTEQLRCIRLVETTDNRIKKISTEHERSWDEIKTRQNQFAVQYQLMREQLSGRINRHYKSGEEMLAVLQTTVGRVDALEKRRHKFFRSDMSTLPDLLSQLDTHP